jgi:two-component system, NtrC family, sensor histidine kinase KinB
MTLRARLLLAVAPLGAALVVLGVVSVLSVTRLGESSSRILTDNYRSVLAAQRMKESIERLDSAALFLVAGERDRARAQAEPNQARFEAELEIQESNLTERGEAAVTRDLRAAWTGYRRAFEAFVAGVGRGPGASAAYFRDLEPRFVAVKSAADRILDLNQDAMVRRSEEARAAARSTRELVLAASVAALVLGMLASLWLTSRMLRPIDLLGAAVRRVGEGDLAVRATVIGKDEIAEVAREFNEMAARLETYRRSSLGDLLQAQQASQAAIDSIPDPVVVFAVDGAVLTSNQAADLLLGMDALEGRPLDRVEPALRATLERVRDHVLSGKGPYAPRGFDEAVVTAASSGEAERYLLARATPLYSEEGSVIGVTVILQDVTRLRRFDELRDNLVATVAHEFRTPLTSLRMAIHLVLEGAAGELSPKQLDVLGAAREDCERLQVIVDDLLDLARLHSGAVELDRQPCDPERLVDEVVQGHRGEAERRGVSLRTAVTPSLGAIQVDPARLRLVFANLTSNAIRHTPSGGTVTLIAAPLGLDEHGVRFAVTDTGPGIAAEHLARVFERFYRVPGQPAEGAGLGLSIAREIVEAHGGEIGVESEPDRGARFWFTIPAASAPT